MSESVKLISDYGIVVVFLGGIILVIVKYLPRLMNVWFSRLESKNSANDLILETVRNNTQIIANNSKVIENNTVAMNRNTDNYEKIDGTLERLNDNICVHDIRAVEIAKDIAVLKERR